MSYDFESGRGYRMPTHFGPIPGPRQRPEGGWYAPDADQRSTSVWASFDVDRAALAALLPAGFEPADEPDITIELKNMTNIGWLAGHGYSVIFVTASVRRTGATDEYPADGRFKLVLWENEADPIITGREELGYPKVFGDITDITVDERDGVVTGASASASWHGFTFFDIEVHDLTDAQIAAPGGASFHTKYIPRTGIDGGHDLVQTIYTPAGQGPLEIVERLSGTGSVTFHEGTFAQLPTLLNIVSAFASLRLTRCRAAGFFRSAGTTDLRDQIVIA